MTDDCTASHKSNVLQHGLSNWTAKMQAGLHTHRMQKAASALPSLHLLCLRLSLSMGVQKSRGNEQPRQHKSKSPAVPDSLWGGRTVEVSLRAGCIFGLGEAWSDQFSTPGQSRPALPVSLVYGELQGAPYTRGSGYPPAHFPRPFPPLCIRHCLQTGLLVPDKEVYMMFAASLERLRTCTSLGCENAQIIASSQCSAQLDLAAIMAAIVADVHGLKALACPNIESVQRSQNCGSFRILRSTNP